MEILHYVILRPNVLPMFSMFIYIVYIVGKYYEKNGSFSC